jgi:hypothetical protein
MRSAAESDSAQKGPDPLEELRARIRRDEIAALDAALASGTDGDGVREPEVGDPAGASALEHAEAALDELFAAGVRPDDARDAVVWIDRLEHLGRRIDAAKSALVGEITRSRFHLTDGHGSPRIMVRHVAKLSEAESLNRTRAAEACADLPKVEAAWQAGTLPTSAANTLGRVHANQRVAPALEARQDEFIADATTMSSKSFASKAHRWERLIDEDGPEPANERNHNNRDTRLRPNPGDLSWDLTGFFASAQGAQMREIFDRNSKPTALQPKPQRSPPVAPVRSPKPIWTVPTPNAAPMPCSGSSRTPPPHPTVRSHPGSCTTSTGQQPRTKQCSTPSTRTGHPSSIPTRSCAAPTTATTSTQPRQPPPACSQRSVGSSSTQPAS